MYKQFFPILGVIFSFSSQRHSKHKSLQSWWCPTYLVFLWMLLLLVSHLRNFCLSSLRCFIVLAVIFGSLVHLGLILGWGEIGIRFVLSRVDVRLSRHHFSKRRFFPRWFPRHPWQKSNDRKCERSQSIPHMEVRVIFLKGISNPITSSSTKHLRPFSGFSSLGQRTKSFWRG